MLPNLPQVAVDPDRTAQVLSNLINNALRYTPQEGCVRLEAADTDTGVTLKVIDNGAGIAAEDLPYVFDRFYRAGESRRGGEGESGLGLAIAKSIVEAHGRTIAVESTPGQGSTFTITLPVVQANHKLVSLG